MPCAAVDDRARLAGKLAERTTDWYTQDAHGTVWYYGERTAELDRRGLETREWTPLEPGVRDGKWYAAGIGVVREATIRGPVEHAQLVAYHR